MYLFSHRKHVINLTPLFMVLFIEYLQYKFKVILEQFMMDFRCNLMVIYARI